MIYIEIKDSFFQYDAFHITKAFYPNETIKSKVIEDSVYMLSFFCVKEADASQKEADESEENRKLEFCIAEAQTGVLPCKGDKAGRKQCKHAVNLGLYDCLTEMTGRSLDWGILTGIRPTKIAMKKWRELQNVCVQEKMELQNVCAQEKMELQNVYGHEQADM